MTINILGFIGSPRKLGNCELMIKEICRQFNVPHRLKLLRLTDFDIRHCTGCYRCLFGECRCVLDDDFDRVLDGITAADALVVAAPTYFLSANATLKQFVDRGLAFYGKADRLWGKPAVGVGVAGIPGMEGATQLDIERLLMAIRAQNRGTRIVYGALPGELFDRPENRQVAAELANSLLSDMVPERQEHQCSICGGETFRFLGGNRVRCMLCSASGRLKEGADGLLLTVDPDEQGLLVGEDEALEHLDWLRGMIKRFGDEKSRLKKVTLGYREDGEWCRPKSRS